MKSVFIASASRTPIGKFGGSFSQMTAVDLGVVAVQSALERAGVRADEVDEVIIGQARQAGSGPNPARQVGFRSGVPEQAPAYTVNKACGSGLKSMILGYQEILLGHANIVVAGGMESMSRVPYLVEGARWGLRLGHQPFVDGMYRDGFFCPLADMVMGETAENLARIHEITREEQDEFAVRSQNRAAEASNAGRFRDELAPVTIPKRKGESVVIDVDEHIRFDASTDGLEKLRPVFSKGGTVTAGNSSGITDGAAATVLVSEEELNRRNLQPLGRIVDYAVAGVDPKVMGIGPVPAIGKLLARTGLSLEDFDLIELNEAFAAQVLACLREVPMDPARLNVNGGAIALGHPIGCTGTRITTTLLHELRRRNGKYGLVTLCISGGMGIALAVEAVS
jgi:acetyl-CoA C-acetyltransferase